MSLSPSARPTCDIYGSGPPRYVLIHGIGGNRRQCRPLAQCLAVDAGVLAIDLAGHGAAKDTPGPYEIHRFGADVADIVSRRGLTDAILIGHSMGAAVCVKAASMLGDAAQHVIGLDALLFPELFGPQAHRKAVAARALLRTPIATRTINSWVRRFFIAPYEPAVRESVLQTMLQTPRPVLADSVASLLRWRRDDALAATDVPVSIFYAARVHRTRQVSELQPRCSITPFARGGHFFFLEYPVDTAAAIHTVTSASNGSGTRS